MQERRGLLVVGEILADVATGAGANRLPDQAASADSDAPQVVNLQARPGGSPANVAVGASRLGLRSSFAGRLSRHGLGPWLAQHLRDNGVDLGPSILADQEATLAMVALDQDGAASYGFYGQDTADWQWSPEELAGAESSGAAALHTGSLASALRPGNAVLYQWATTVRAGGEVLVSYDPNTRVRLIDDIARYGAEVLSWVSVAHLVKVSSEDLAVLYPGEDPLDAAARWVGKGPEMVVVTLGKQGCAALRTDGSLVHRPAPAVRVADTVGAGDACTAVLLAWLAESGHLRPGGPASLDASEVGNLLEVANLVAALTCSRPGANPPRREEVAGAPWPEPARR